ncbi:hypothetical protein GF312_15240 [Candidatus Poribacteria bacterium]|nr:hypothetical protein [Candidatus Poribacteria bacterium]
MGNKDNQKHDRREFLRTLGRYTILGGLFSIGGFLAINRKMDFSCPAPQDGSPKRLEGICRSCVVFKDCDLPLAEDIKSKNKKIQRELRSPDKT